MRVLIWGRDGNYGPDYPRNRVIREALTALGHDVAQFKPLLSPLADLEAMLRHLPPPDVIWVPCFRQRDVRAAARYARRHGIPLIFDPLISAWDKQVNEREKFPAGSTRAQRLLSREKGEFSVADVVVADTDGHAAFFHEVLGVPRERLQVVPVGAEEALFRQHAMPVRAADELPEIAFFGTFIGLHGIETVLDAIALYAANRAAVPVRWRLLGDGPLRDTCEQRVAALRRQWPELDIAIEGWRPLAELPGRLARADAFLGIFGTSAKARRVIPNKVYQALAIGRPVITASSDAYPPALLADEQHGLVWCPPGDAHALAHAVMRLLGRRSDWPALAAAARAAYDAHFSAQVIRGRVADALASARAAAMRRA